MGIRTLVLSLPDSPHQSKQPVQGSSTQEEVYVRMSEAVIFQWQWTGGTHLVTGSALQQDAEVLCESLASWGLIHKTRVLTTAPNSGTS